MTYHGSFFYLKVLAANFSYSDSSCVVSLSSFLIRMSSGSIRFVRLLAARMWGRSPKMILR